MDLTQLIFHSGYNGMPFNRSGVQTHTVSGTYTVGATTTYTLATGIDTTKQMALLFGVNGSASSTVPYLQSPNTTSVWIDDGSATPQEVYVDDYYYVDASGNLILKFKNFSYTHSTGSSYPITDDANIRMVYYIIDLPQIT